MLTIAAVRRSPWWGRLVILWSMLLVAALIALLKLFRDLNVEGYHSLGWRQVVYNIPVVAVVFLMTRALMRSHRWLEWKPSDLIFGTGPGAASDGSLLIKAMRVRWIGPVVTLLLALNLPVIAMLEEFIFRNGTTSWRSAVFRSLLFGLAHLTANVPIGACLAVGMTGLWFSHWYFLGGLEMAARMHFGYIFIIIGLSAPAVLLQHFKRSPS